MPVWQEISALICFASVQEWFLTGNWFRKNQVKFQCSTRFRGYKKRVEDEYRGREEEVKMMLKERETD